MGTGAAQGLLGAGAGAIGGKVAGAVVGKLGSFAGSIGGRMLSGGISGAVSDAAYQLGTTGHIDLGGVAMSAGIGAAFGGFYKGGCRGGRHSFDPNTKVVMADGSTRPIKDVNVGDKVTATDPETGKTAAKPVTQLHRNTDHDMTDVAVTRIAPGKGTKGTASNGPVKTLAKVAAAAVAVAAAAVLHTTAHHPFWDETSGKWVNAAELTVGHEMRTLDGAQVTVTAVHSQGNARPHRRRHPHVLCDGRRYASPGPQLWRWGKWGRKGVCLRC